MYSFHYEQMKPMYGDNIELLYTDTDSLVYNIKTDDLFKDMAEHDDYFDFSEYKNTCMVLSIYKG